MISNGGLGIVTQLKVNDAKFRKDKNKWNRINKIGKRKFIWHETTALYTFPGIIMAIIINLLEVDFRLDVFISSDLLARLIVYPGVSSFVGITFTTLEWRRLKQKFVRHK